MPNTLTRWIACVVVALIGALIAAMGLRWARRPRDGRHGRRRSDTASSAIDGIGTREFCARVGRAFQGQGYQLIGTGADGHADLVLRRDRQTFLVLCKHWQVPKVDIDAVHALQLAMTARGAAGGFALTAGRFSREAVTFAASANIRLIDGAALGTLIDRRRAAPAHDAGPDTMPLR